MAAGQAYAIVRHMKFATKKSGKKLSKVADAVSKGLPGSVSRADAVASNANQDGEAVLSEEEWETIDSPLEIEDEARAETINMNNATSHSHSTQKNISGSFHQKDRFHPGASGFAAHGTGQGSSRSVVGISKEPSVAENNRYAKRTEVMGGFPHQNVMNRSNAAPYPRAPRYDVRAQQEPIRRGQVHQFDPNQGPLRATKAPDSGDHHRFGGVDMTKPSDGESHRPNYGNFTTQKANPQSQPRISDENLEKQRTGTPIFGNFLSKKAAAASDQNLGDDSAPDKSSYSPATSKYGIFSASKATSSRN